MQDDTDAIAEPKVKGGRTAGGKGGGGAKAAGGGRKAAADAGPKNAGGGGGGGGGGPKNSEVLIARMIVRAQWHQEWSAANPEGEQADRKAAWKEVRQVRMEENMKSARRILGSLHRQGVTMTLSETAAAKQDAAGDEDDDSEA